MKSALAAVGFLALGAAFAVIATAAPRHDFAAVARDILPPGNFGGANFTAHSTDQAVLYDALTPLFDKVTAADVAKDFKAEPLWTGKEKAVRVESPGRGVTIRRDAFDVPHVFGRTEAAVFYGAGWAAAEDSGRCSVTRGRPSSARSGPAWSRGCAICRRCCGWRRSCW